MRAISLWQPWASYVAFGLKKIETRSWGTPYRGPIAIHAAKRKPQAEDLDDELMSALSDLVPATDPHHRSAIGMLTLPFGAVVAVAELYGCDDINVTVGGEVQLQYADPYENEHEISCGNYDNGRFAWLLSNVQRLEPPIAARGMQGLFDWTPPINVVRCDVLPMRRA